MTRWLGAAAMPVVLGALLTTAHAQGKGKGGGGAGRPEQPAPAAQSRGAAQNRGQGGERGARAMQAPQERAQRGNVKSRGGEPRANESRANESRGGEVARSRVPASAERGKAIERGNPSFDAGRVRGRLHRTITVDDLRADVRPFATSGRPAERFLGRAVGLGEMRGLSGNDLKIARAGDRVHVLNGRGDVLLNLDDQHAREIGAWKVATVDAEDRADGAPAFCRSGAGHPVWGRQWCVDKGFGLGMENDIRWGRATNVGDLVLRQPRSTGDLRRDVLAQVLGDVVYNRLAAHAITLGLTDPLTGRWMGETTGPRVLLVSAGDHPVAEVVDRNRDSRADMLLVALRPW